MWLKKYEIVSVVADPTPNMAVYTLRYFNEKGGTVDRVERTGDPSTLNQLAMRNIADLERIDAINTAISTPPLGEVDLTPVPLTPEQIHERELIQKKNELSQASTDLKLGVITDAEYQTILAEYKTLVSEGGDVISIGV